MGGVGGGGGGGGSRAVGGRGVGIVGGLVLVLLVNRFILILQCLGEWVSLCGNIMQERRVVWRSQ